MNCRSTAPSDAVDQNLVIDTLNRIYDGIVSTEAIRRAVEAAWWEPSVRSAGDRDFLPVRVARQVRQSLRMDSACSATL